MDALALLTLAVVVLAECTILAWVVRTRRLVREVGDTLRASVVEAQAAVIATVHEVIEQRLVKASMTRLGRAGRESQAASAQDAAASELELLAELGEVGLALQHYLPEQWRQLASLGPVAVPLARRLWDRVSRSLPDSAQVSVSPQDQPRPRREKSNGAW